jgi:MFS family permease
MTEISAGKTGSRLRVIFAACIGSALEWYDFFLYGTAAALVFGDLFFPKSDPIVGTLLAFLTFGVGFVVRPLGGILFGILGDRFGRKPVLVATLLMLGIGTTAIGLLPTYAQIGYWAPLLLVLMRVIQGLGAGAEYGGAVIYLVENAPAHRRGFWGSFAPLGVSIGNLLAAGAFALVTPLPREDLLSWGWRLPFLASFLLILVGIFVRLRVAETPVYTEPSSRVARSSKTRRWKHSSGTHATSWWCSARGWPRTGSATCSRYSA